MPFSLWDQNHAARTHWNTATIVLYLARARFDEVEMFRLYRAGLGRVVHVPRGMSLRPVEHAAELQVPCAGQARLFVDPERARTNSFLVHQRLQFHFVEEVAGGRAARGINGLACVLRHGHAQQHDRSPTCLDGGFLFWLQIHAASPLGFVRSGFARRSEGDFRVPVLYVNHLSAIAGRDVVRLAGFNFVSCNFNSRLMVR